MFFWSIALSVITLILIFAALGIILGISLPIFFWGAPYLPTPKRTIKKAVELAGIKEGSRVADIGAGDGRFLIEAAGAGASGVGYEINPWLVLLANFNIKRVGVGDKVSVKWRSFWKADLSEYDVVFVYGITNIMNKLAKKLDAELKPGAIVIAHAFPLPSWKEQNKENPLYLYKKP
ncbi:hypothetical protein C4553_03295 [Candidatus Parcubacteria bacterium]|nr:MAG: hypothetical protein C4553_03295 [Candidatus Parcubacteria bacterium]